MVSNLNFFACFLNWDSCKNLFFRSNHACAVVKVDAETETIVVVGGFGAADETDKIAILDSVEVYNPTTGEFELGE